MAFLSKYKFVIIAGVFISLGLYFMVFGKKKPDTPVSAYYNKDSIPTLNTSDVIAQISDSGIVRYKITAKTWLAFEDAREPYWLFPDKFHLEQYDTLSALVATVEADSVWNYKSKNLWELRGNVRLENVEGKVFTSQELFWDEKKGSIYSNLYVEIIEPNQAVIRGTKFTAKQDMTEYSLLQIKDADLYYDEESESDREKTE